VDGDLILESAVEKDANSSKHVFHGNVLQARAPRAVFEGTRLRVPAGLLGEVGDDALGTLGISLKVHVRGWLTIPTVPGRTEEHDRGHIERGGDAQWSSVRTHGYVCVRQGGGELAKRTSWPHARSFFDEPDDTRGLLGVGSYGHHDVRAITISESPAQGSPTFLRPALHLHPHVWEQKGQRAA
jgi:hypothetical protein